MVALVFLLPWLQFTAPPQARTPEEYDAYLAVFQSAAANAPAAAQAFEKAFPNSGLLPRVQERCFEAYRQLGDRARAIASGEASLQGNPHNLPLRAALALVLANGAENESQVARAESHARQALNDLDGFRPPRTTPLEEWRRISGGIRASAHSALGLIAYRRNQTSEAIREFETAAQFGPDPAVYYRLGKLYNAAGRRPDALAMFRKAAQGGEPAIRALAELELKP